MSWQSYRSTLFDVERRAQTTAVMLREHSLRVFEAQGAVIRAVDQRLSGKDWDEIAASDEIHGLLADFARNSPHIDGIWIARPDGFTIASADYFPMNPVDIRDREYFQALSSGQTIHLGRMRGKLKGNVNFNFGQRRATPDGRFDGTILITTDANYFTNYWRTALGEGAHTAAIVRDDGEILARYPETEQTQMRVPADSQFFEAARNGGFDFVNFNAVSHNDGEYRRFAIVKLGSLPAHLVVGLSIGDSLVAWRQATTINVIVGLLVSLALLVVVRMAWQRQIRLREEIEHRLRVESTLIAKEEHLAALERLEAARRESEERFRSLFETLTQGVTILDAEGRIVQANDAAGSILGISPRNLTQLTAETPDFHSVDADGQPLPLQRHPSIRAMTERRVIKGEVVGTRHLETGDRRWMVVDAIPRFEPDNPNPIGVFCLFSDITGRRRSEEAQRLLVREVDHRAKNALAVVQALIRLTRADTIKDFIEVVEGRIGALARAHTLLARNRWEGASLRTLAEEELSPYAHEKGHVTIEGPSLTLTAEAAQPISMVLHELATNAAKYGALSVPDGRLSVSWRAEPESPEFRIDWVETGGPRVAVPEGAGFGSRLIRMNLESQLRGRVDYVWEETGLRVGLVVPSVNIQSFGASDGERAELRVLPGAATLKGVRILVAEDSAPVAANLCALLRDLGCVVLGPASSVDEVRQLAKGQLVDVAVLDIDLRGESVLPTAQDLRQSGVSVVFCSGFGEIAEAEGRWSDTKLLRKPVVERDLVVALVEVLRESPRHHAIPA